MHWKIRVQQFQFSRDLKQVKVKWTTRSKASCKFAEKIGIDPEEDFKKHHRKRRKPARADDNPNTQVDLTMPQHFRKEFKSVLDTFINMFEDKIAPTLDTVLPMVRVLQPPFKDTIPNDDNVVALCNMFVTEKDPGAVSVELELFRERTSDETITNTAEAIKLAFDNRSSLPQLWGMLQTATDHAHQRCKRRENVQRPETC